MRGVTPDPGTAYGHDLDLDVYRFPPERVAELLREAGLVEVARLVREADTHETTPQAFVLARNSPQQHHT
ncbi:hypothetical protein ACGFY3_37055 [Streptomyces mirabilis]|uniref:hypothetical protein n=1 Tax=Streptomyces mirabilis TaxID=68239 RepID=UPI0037244821